MQITFSLYIIFILLKYFIVDYYDIYIMITVRKLKIEIHIEIIEL